MQLSNILSIASVIISTVSIVWIGGFRFSALIHEVKGLGDHVQKLENRIDNLEIKMETRFEKLEAKMDARIGKLEDKADVIKTDLHKVDIRVTVVEQDQKKPSPISPSPLPAS